MSEQFKGGPSGPAFYARPISSVDPTSTPVFQPSASIPQVQHLFPEEQGFILQNILQLRVHHNVMCMALKH